MKLIRLDATGWQTPDDFYSSLLPKLGAPAWHGRNLDALEESLRDGDVKAVQPPYVVEVNGFSELPEDMRTFVAQVASIFEDIRIEFGTDVSFMIG